MPVELRDGNPRVPAADDAEGLSALVTDQIERLRADQEESLDRLDESERLMAAAGMPLDEDAATRRLRRYESSCRRAMHWARAELLRAREGIRPAHEPSMQPPARFEPPAPAPPTDGPPSEPARNAPEPADEPTPDAPTAPLAPPPTPGTCMAFAAPLGLSPTPRNRRERKAMERRARQGRPASAPSR